MGAVQGARARAAAPRASLNSRASATNVRATGAKRTANSGSALRSALALFARLLRPVSSTDETRKTGATDAASFANS